MTVFVDNHIVIVKSGYCLELNLIKFTKSKKKKRKNFDSRDVDYGVVSRRSDLLSERL